MKNTLFVIMFLVTNGLLNQSFSQALTVKLWPEGVPNSIENCLYKERKWTTPDRSYYASVTDPEIKVYLAPKAVTSGTAVIICPGGGYTRLAFGHEGVDIAEWFNSNGITAIILKYRLPSDSIMADKSIGPLQDAQEAIRIVRRRSQEWGIDPSRIGIMGFSAGGHLASTLATHFNEKVYEPADNVSARPDFAILIYPVISLTKPMTHNGTRSSLLGNDPDTTAVVHFSNQYQVTPETPQVFLVHSSDDKAVPVANSLDFYKALVINKVPAEMHIFQQGGHGYGLAVGKKTESQWPDLCINWLKANGFAGDL
jgi:acetyl esterase/lipase